MRLRHPSHRLMLLVAVIALPSSTAAASGQAQSEATTEYQIELRTLDPQPTLSIRKAASIRQISSVIGQRTRRVWQYLQEVGVQPAGPPFTRYHGVSGDSADLEVGFPVQEAVEGRGDVQDGRLPGGEVVMTVHRGPYEGLTKAGAALDRWLEENGREARGPNWEVYRVNAGTVDDPTEYETDVFKPIR